jgi:hypothetical protein
MIAFRCAAALRSRSSPIPRLIVDVGGVGYDVHGVGYEVPLSTFYGLGTSRRARSRCASTRTCARTRSRSSGS